MHLLMYYFVSSELGVANFLQRHFDWSSNSLWYEEIPNAWDPTKSMFVLGGQDAIVKSEVSASKLVFSLQSSIPRSVFCGTFDLMV
jgi:hypothetical protein